MSMKKSKISEILNFKEEEKNKVAVLAVLSMYPLGSLRNQLLASFQWLIALKSHDPTQLFISDSKQHTCHPTITITIIWWRPLWSLFMDIRSHPREFYFNSKEMCSAFLNKIHVWKVWSGDKFSWTTLGAAVLAAGVFQFLFRFQQKCSGTI